MSTIKIGVFGSCPTRDIFNSSINKNYKDYFTINLSYVNNSIISNMQEPVPYDKQSIKILPDNKENQSFSSFIEKDLDKLFFDRLSRADIDYLLIDAGLEVKWGLVEFDNHIFFNYPRYDKTEFFNNITNKRFITIQNDTNEYMKLFKESYTKFFDKMNDEYPDITVILNPVREAYRVLKSDGSIEENTEFKNRTDNHYLPLIDSYIAKKFDVEILEYNKDVLLDENHQWGLGPKHYVEDYYIDYTRQICEIDRRNKLLAADEYNELNRTIRKDRLNNHIQKAEYELELIEKDKYVKEIKKQLNSIKDDYDKQVEENKQIESEKVNLTDKLNSANDKINLLEEDVKVTQQSINTIMADGLNPVELKRINREQSDELKDLKEEKMILLSLRDKLVENNEDLKERNQKLNNTIESIYSSNSWKLTSSLRNLKRKI
ncbi:MAG: hypothetical protein BZ133_02105 [Methanosphaera sp. SHI613]|nr:MAG: hypothetical protein BZ133_02105 [Methanosphaera sp. SHI613]